MLEILRMLSSLSSSLNPFSFLLCWNGLELSKFKSFFFSSLLEWARALQVFPSVSFLDLLEFCSLRC